MKLRKILIAVLCIAAFASCRNRSKQATVETVVEEDTTPKVVLPEQVYVRTSCTATADSSHIVGFAAKGDSLKIIGYEGLREDGTVEKYLVKLRPSQTVRTAKSDTGYVYSRYTALTDSAAAVICDSIYLVAHQEVKNRFGGGKATGCDFLPVEKPLFAENHMPDTCRTLYLNCGTNILKNIDEYIALAHKTDINAFVVDIFDNQVPSSPYNAMAKYSPTNYRKAIKQQAVYARAIKRLKEEGFYVIGRITCFKDSYFVKDHPECALSSRYTGEPYLHNKAYWPSAYDRYIWEYKVCLAKEAVERYGFNEINFDYVRFPDKLQGIQHEIDFKNKFHESTIQAIQNFVRYACDELHQLRVYVSIDVFGECVNGYTTPYGQYWPAISNVADVICAMPYPDHFAKNSFGIDKPWNNPYRLMKSWGERAAFRQTTCPTPAIARTWIQAYDVMRHVDRNGIEYNAYNVRQEIEGLRAAGLPAGYITWHSGSKLSKYQSQAPAFRD